MTTSARGKQAIDEGSNRSIGYKSRTARRHHNRVNDDMTGSMTSKGLGDGAHDIGRRDHAYFHRIGRISSNTASIWATTNDGSTSTTPEMPSVFCAVSAVIALVAKKTVGLDGLDISLNAGSTARIGARDGENGSHGYRPRRPRA